MSVSRIIQQAAAGNAGGGALYVEDVFSTYLYEGNGSTQTITNGIDLSGEGGMVWIKNRYEISNPANSTSHLIADTVRGATKRLIPDSAAGEGTTANSVTGFNSDGFDMGSYALNNSSGNKYCSWTFRKQPGFFDVVKYTGDGTAGREIAHNLGSTPGMIIVKNLSTAFNWQVYHRGTDAVAPENYYLQLDRTNARTFDTGRWGGTAPTEQAFTVGNSPATNESGSEHIAYIFAHDVQEFGTDSDESIIKCGSYTGNGSTTGPVIDLGWEPQFIFIKNINTGGTWWVMLDSMRGIVSGNDEAVLKANTSDSEFTDLYLTLTSTGFQPTSNSPYVNGSGNNYVYMAIRRPHKSAEEFAATELFHVESSDFYNSIKGNNFPADMALFHQTASANFNRITTRLTGTGVLFPNATNAESSESYYSWDNQQGMEAVYTSNLGNWGWKIFRRAPGFFDVVTYTGNGTGQDIPHNLGVAPEMMWIKRRNYDYRWTVYYPEATNRGTLELNTNAAKTLNSSTWNDTAPTATHFTVGTDFSVNHTHPYIAYLFASVAGISKVGSYTGTGSDVDVDCGFSAGARFVLVKRTDSTGDWYLWDTARGIVAGNEPYVLINDYDSDVTGRDYIDPLSSGFTITSSAPAALNASGGNYIFYAIA